MRIGPMLEHLPAGKHFRRPHWPKDQYIFLDEGRYKMHMPGGMTKDFVVKQEELSADDYETC